MSENVLPVISSGVLWCHVLCLGASLVGQTVKHLPAMQETWVILSLFLCKIWRRALTSLVCIHLHSFPSTICWRDFFLTLCILVPLSKINWPQDCGLISGWSILLYWSICLFSLLISHYFDYCNFVVLFSQFSSVAQSCLTLCDPLDCSMPGLPVHHSSWNYSNSCPLSWWCHQTISSSVVPFSSCLQSFPASGSLQMSQFFPTGGQNIGVSASISVFQWGYIETYVGLCRFLNN